MDREQACESVWPVGRALMSWRELLCKPLDWERGALTCARVVWALALEADAPCTRDRRAAILRRVDLEQQAALQALLPRGNACERLLLALFAYMEMAAAAAQREQNARVRAAVDFLLPEMCDMLYRAANLLSLVYGRSADALLQGEAEILPGRPCIAAHRHPLDDACRPPEDIGRETALALRLLRAMARYCAGLCLFSVGDLGAGERALYAELALILGGHQALLESLLGGEGTMAEALRLHEYAECWLYQSLCAQEEDAEMRALYARALVHERAHLQKALALCPDGAREARADLPPPLRLGPNKGYIRDAMRLVGVTLRQGRELPVGALPGGADFFRYQKRLHGEDALAPSHAVVCAHIRAKGADYRRQIAPHPVEMLRARTSDSCGVGR